MATRRLQIGWLVCVALISAGAYVLAQPAEPVDLDAITRIKEEGFERSQVMDIAWWLTDVHGPRLTNSPQMRAAANWTVTRLTEWGLANVKLEPWGTAFGRGWSNERTAVHVLKPSPWPVLAYARAWTPGTGGPVTAEAVLAPLANEGDFDKYRGKLKGKIVLPQNAREVAPLFEAPARRLTTEPGGHGSPDRRSAAGRWWTGQRPAIHRQAERVSDCRRGCRGTRAGQWPRRQRQHSGWQRRFAQRQGSASAAAIGSRDRTLQPDRTAGRPRTGGDPRDRRPQHLQRRRPQHVQHHRGDSRHRSGRRGRHARCAFRLVAQTTHPGRR